MRELGLGLWVLVVAVLGAPFAVFAQDNGGIRFVTPPLQDDHGPRITIQITDEDRARQAEIAERPAPGLLPSEEPMIDPPADGAVALPAQNWFWAGLPATLPADPARFWTALARLETAPEAAQLGAPRLETLQSIATEHGRTLLAASIGTDVSPAFALAVIAAESAGRAQAESSAGAQGLMQLIPDTAARFGVEEPFDPAQNIAGGIAYLDWLMAEFDRDPVLVLAAYNAGEGAVRRAGGVPDFPETRTYIPRVLAAWQLARGLCLSPPELVSDGCVFASMN